jgi:dipeptidase E
LDLRQFFGRATELEVVLRAIGLVWVMGGNTFVLRRAFRQSGLDSMLVDYRCASKSELVYGGLQRGQRRGHTDTSRH